MKKFLVRYIHENMVMTVEMESANIMAVMHTLTVSLMNHSYLEDVKQIHIEEMET